MMQSISTKTGDRGESSLANGMRLPKSNQVFEVLGSIDELNAHLGLCASMFGDQKKELLNNQKIIFKIQDALFYFGAKIAKANNIEFDIKALKLVEKESQRLQKSMEDNWTTQFLLPGGNLLSSQLDIARAVARRAERELFKYADLESVDAILFQYLNRLSDYLFVLRCYVNRICKVDEKMFNSSFQKRFFE